MSQVFEHTHEAELEAQQLVNKWLQERCSDSSTSLNNTKSLKTELLGYMQSKTFNSPIIMRLYTEVLLCEHDFEEAFASFDAYVELQRLNLFKSNSGARATYDDLDATTELFNMKLDLLENFEMVSQEILRKMREQLTSICNEIKDLPEYKVSAPFSRIALLLALKAENDEMYNSEIANAKEWFDKLDCQSLKPHSGNGDGGDFGNGGNMLTNADYFRGLFLALTETPIAAFKHVKEVLNQDPNNIRCALLLIRLLTAQDQYEEALSLTEIYLKKVDDYKTTADKITILNLKKTHLGILELLKGPDVAITELTEFITLVSGLFLPHAQVEKMNSTRSVREVRNAQTQPLPVRSRIFSFRRKFDTTAIASETLTPQRVNFRDQLESRDSVIMAFSWFWIAQQYLRAELLDDAKKSLVEALEFLSSDMSLIGTAEKYTLYGIIERKQNKLKARKYFAQALIANPIHIVAAVSASLTLAVGDEEGSDALSEDDKAFARNIMVNLETIVTRMPGRFVPEVWMARGRVYEALGDMSAAREMYWKCVQLEERKAITSYVLSSSLLTF